MEEITVMLLPHHFCPHLSGWGCSQDSQLYYKGGWEMSGLGVYSVSLHRLCHITEFL